MDTTYVSSYQILRRVADMAYPDPDLALATGFGGRVDPREVDLLANHGAAVETRANAVCLILNAKNTAPGTIITQTLYGRSDNGPYQEIADIQWTIGSARADGQTSTFLWATSAAVVNNYHPTAVVAKSGPVGSVWFDACGYRSLLALLTARTGSAGETTLFYRVY